MANQYFLGKREQIAWGEESTFGTEVSPTEIVGLNARVEPNRDQGWNEILSAGSDTRAPESEAIGAKTARFRLVFVPYSWKFLKYVFDVSDSGTSPTTHSLSIADQLNSFTLEWARRGDTNSVITFTGCTITSLTLNFNKPTGGGEGMLEVSAEVLAQDWSHGNTVTSVSSVEDKSPYHYRHAKFTFNGSEVTEVASGSITIANGINPDDSRYANPTLDRKIGRPIPTVFRLSGNLTINPKDDTYESQFSAGTTVSNCKLEFIRDASSDYLMFEFSHFRFNLNDPTTLEGISVAEMSWSTRTFSNIEAVDNLSW